MKEKKKKRKVKRGVQEREDLSIYEMLIDRRSFRNALAEGLLWFVLACRFRFSKHFFRGAFDLLGILLAIWRVRPAGGCICKEGCKWRRTNLHFRPWATEESRSNEPQSGNDFGAVIAIFFLTLLLRYDEFPPLIESHRVFAESLLQIKNSAF